MQGKAQRWKRIWNAVSFDRVPCELHISCHMAESRGNYLYIYTYIYIVIKQCVSTSKGCFPIVDHKEILRAKSFYLSHIHLIDPPTFALPENFGWTALFLPGVGMLIVVVGSGQRPATVEGDE